MNKRLAVYAGTFDYLTVGHLWMIKKGSKIFDKLIVSIGVNPEKHCVFTVEERLKMLKESTSRFSNVSIRTFTNQYLIKYAEKVGAEYILRGIRNGNDYLYEKDMRNINSDLNSKITTIFLMPPRDIAEVSSSRVKGLVGPEGWESVVKKYVPKAVFNKIKEKHYAVSK